MAFYNNAFKKVMLGTGTTVTNFTTDFLVTATGKTLEDISNLGPGYVAILDPSSYTSVNPATYTGDFIVANTSLFTSDRYGSHGGYKMCDLSKYVRPSYAELAYLARKTDPHPFVLSIGNYQYQMNSNTYDNTDPDCVPKFYCDQTYLFRIDIKGSPVLRTYAKNMYRWIEVKTPCCVGGQVVQIDPTWVFIQIAEGILRDPYLSQFVVPVVFSNGADGSTNVNYIAPSSFNVTYPSIVSATTQWDTYSLGNGVNPANVLAGLTLIGAYVDSTFTNCSFIPSDYEEYQPVKIEGQFVDMHGNPCETMEYCTTIISSGVQGNGYGLTLQKDLLLSQAYLQNFLSDDPRIREVNGGIDMLIDRTVKYNRFGFIHTVPRFLGGSSDANLGSFNTDRYVIEIATPLDPPPSGINGYTILDTFLANNFGTRYDTTSGVYTYHPTTFS